MDPSKKGFTSTWTGSPVRRAKRRGEAVKPGRDAALVRGLAGAPPEPDRQAARSDPSVDCAAPPAAGTADGGIWLLFCPSAAGLTGRRGAMSAHSASGKSSRATPSPQNHIALNIIDGIFMGTGARPVNS